MNLYDDGPGTNRQAPADPLTFEPALTRLKLDALLKFRPGLTLQELTDLLRLDPLLTPKETACLLKVSVGTLAVWRCTKQYSLQYVKIGKRLVRYHIHEVNRFLEEWKPTRPT